MTDRTFIVTGGSGGLGKATSKELGRNGHTVVVNDLPTQEENAAAIAESVEEAGGTATIHLGDVSNLEYTDELINTVVDTYGRLDGVINYAGLLRDAYLTEMTASDWEDVISVHLRGHFGLLRSAARLWSETAEERSDPRSFVCVTSPSALGNVGQANYSAAKAGVLGLMRTAATELEKFDIHVNALLPIAYTKMTENILDSDEYPPEKVAPVAAFLANAEASDMTGCTVRAAGDSVGILSNPEVERVGFSSGGWNTDELYERREQIFGDKSNRYRTNNQI
ncbi:SDR family NAD(P)-dependent oxidoreductase [Halopenitus persicus]|uniref:3-oxoacyl-[acyl-carrier protein] reductase n=1 Tax=Halopenitus persicus TaxID=1048396 RepID=A0A1H3HKN8_9EURY|nr:SDR family NAD(P)-dependent oxidoreductase [Halopenitus persicus]SDY16002.1 3-oxoacyl-[acyl-carrier protein] reductase [Halopenitus persicus]